VLESRIIAGFEWISPHKVLNLFSGYFFGQLMAFSRPRSSLGLYCGLSNCQPLRGNKQGIVGEQGHIFNIRTAWKMLLTKSQSFSAAESLICEICQTAYRRAGSQIS